MSGKKVDIPLDLYEWVEGRLSETEFSSVDEYVAYVVSEVRKNIDGEVDDDGEEGFSKEDEQKVKERLRALGYLD